MNRYDRTLSVMPRRKRHRGLKIFLGIVILLLVAAGIAFALNYNTVLLFAGKGTVSVPKTSAMEKALKASDKYENVKTRTDASGNTVVTANSTDGAVSFQSTTGSSGDTKVEVQMDVKKMKGVSTSRSLSNLKAMQAKVNEYLSAVIEPSQLSGVESYVAREALSQYQSGQRNFSVSHNFNGTQLDVTGDFETGVVHVNAEGGGSLSK